MNWSHMAQSAVIISVSLLLIYMYKGYLYTCTVDTVLIFSNSLSIHTMTDGFNEGYGPLKWW